MIYQKILFALRWHECPGMLSHLQGMLSHLMPTRQRVKQCTRAFLSSRGKYSVIVPRENMLFTLYNNLKLKWRQLILNKLICLFITSILKFHPTLLCLAMTSLDLKLAPISMQASMQYREWIHVRFVTVSVVIKLL